MARSELHCMSCCALRCSAMKCRAVLCYALLRYYAVLYSFPFFLSFRFFSFPILPFLSLSFHSIPFHSVLFSSPLFSSLPFCSEREGKKNGLSYCTIFIILNVFALSHGFCFYYDLHFRLSVQGRLLTASLQLWKAIRVLHQIKLKVLLLFRTSKMILIMYSSWKSPSFYHNGPLRSAGVLRVVHPIWPITADSNNIMHQSEREEKACNRWQAREKHDKAKWRLVLFSLKTGSNQLMFALIGDSIMQIKFFQTYLS